ncbi:ERF family protein [Methanohalobium sp.]|uniref:ERF family protein n=1 Tax=Methanohalobium sp. TaxID=2837493 RepID=UPI0025F12004|nr:ERF family protein [Methanohalobium sp.]
MSEVYKKLIQVQNNLKVPKNQYNDFGGYSFRSCEDILEAVKPILAEYNMGMKVGDELVMKGERYYIKATVTIIDLDSGDMVTNMAYARETESKKGMDKSQITGTASSYARKYALDGMFALDESKDADATNKHGEEDRTVRSDKSKKDSNNSSVMKSKCDDCGKELGDAKEKINNYCSSYSDRFNGKIVCFKCQQNY